MIESLFNRIYSYRERVNKDSKENFLIEIFAFCLENDNHFFVDFLNLLKIKNDKCYRVNTQVVYENGRPDIELFLKTNNTSIIIECKIEHFERPNQLNDYINILKKKKEKEKHLVYLTKYYDLKDITDEEVNFHQYKWIDIYSIINEKNQQITIQLKHFLKELNMAESNNFQYQDLSAISNITSTIRKMDEVLDGIKPYFEKNIGKFSKDSSRSTRLSEERYINFHSVSKDSVQLYSVEAGFYWWDDDITICIRIYIPNREKNKNASLINSFFKKNLVLWENDDWDDSFNYWYYESVAKFIIDGNEQIPAMINFLKEGVNQLAVIKKLK